MNWRRVPRISRVEGYVGGTRLENTQDGDDHLQGAFQTDANQHLRSRPESLKVVRQLVGPPVQLPVGEPLLLVGNRLRLRHPGRLLFKQLVDTPVAGVRGLGVVPLRQRLPPLGFRRLAAAPAEVLFRLH